MTDINITRHGRWEVQIDGVIYSSHNEPKEGYENLIDQTSANPDKQVRLVPNFYIDATVTVMEEQFTLTDAEVQAMIKDLPQFVEGNEYEYVMFEIDNDGVKNISEPKTMTT